MIFRATIRAIIAATVLSLAGIAHADEPYSKWFGYGSSVGKAWTVSGDPDDPMRLTLRPKEGGSGVAKHVLVLYPRPSSAYDIAITAILRDFAAKNVNAVFSVVNFGLKDDKGMESIHDAERQNIDLIFAMGSESSAWLYGHYRGGKIPVVTVCSKDPVQLGQVRDYDHGSGTNIAFTSLNVPVEVQMAYVRELKPHLKNIAILVDSKNVSAMQTQAEPVAEFAHKAGVAVHWVEVKDPKNARAELERLVPAAVAAMKRTDPTQDQSLFWLTGSTSVFREIATINKYSERVPVVSVVPEIVSPGAQTAAMAIGVSFDSNARLAAIYGERILAGEPAAAMKVGLVSPPDIAISFLKTREIGMRVPFSFFEIASTIYDYDGRAVRTATQNTN